MSPGGGGGGNASEFKVERWQHKNGKGHLLILSILCFLRVPVHQLPRSPAREAEFGVVVSEDDVGGLGGEREGLVGNEGHEQQDGPRYQQDPAQNHEYRRNFHGRLRDAVGFYQSCLLYMD